MDTNSISGIEGSVAPSAPLQQPVEERRSETEPIAPEIPEDSGKTLDLYV
jgi:hypothetical protein